MRSDRAAEEIKERIDIVDFISGYVQLKKSGQNWKGVCPFHAEKTPSFMVSPSKQIYHCFGCGAGGDVISFLVNHDRISFPEALQELARKAGISLQSVRQDSRSMEKNEQIRNALRDAARFYSEKLKSSPAAAKYIAARGISNESVSTFGLGYAPSGWRNLLQLLVRSGYSEEILKEAGLVVIGEKGPYDMFRERIIFPIMATNGNVIAFGGRAMDDSLPKYINSPETAVFRKSETLYGIHAAKEAIRRQEQVIVTEGYMDVIMCHQYGFSNAVAPLGTSFTSGHAAKLRKLVKNVIVVFDGDSAGIAAAKRALPLFIQNDLDARILILPDREDPDSFLRKHGREAFGGLLKKAVNMVDFVLSYSKGQRSSVVRELLSLIAGMPDILEAEQMLVELAGRTRISESALRDEFRKLRKGQKAGTDAPAAVKQEAGRIPEEELLLSIAIASPEKIGKILELIDPGMFSDGTAATLLRKICGLFGKTGTVTLPDDSTDEERVLYTRLSVEPGFDPEFIDRTIEDCAGRICKKKLDAGFSMAGASDDLKLLNALLMEKKNLLKGKGHEKR